QGERPQVEEEEEAGEDELEHGDVCVDVVHAVVYRQHEDRQERVERGHAEQALPEPLVKGPAGEAFGSEIVDGMDDLGIDAVDRVAADVLVEVDLLEREKVAEDDGHDG